MKVNEGVELGEGGRGGSTYRSPFSSFFMYYMCMFGRFQSVRFPPLLIFLFGPAGIMVTGDTNDATDEAVQANIVGVGYKNL